MDDRSALTNCIAGDADSFRFIVERYQRQAIGHAMGILGNRDDALDVVQEAFVDAFRSIEKFDLSRSFYPWFYVLLRNRCYKVLPRVVRSRVDEEQDPDMLAPQSNISIEEIMSLEKALFELSTEAREIVTLKYLDGLSYLEIAELLNIPKGTVMSRLYTARKELQSKLTGNEVRS
jgi:RNA polymerase sigma-70 factor, ECF subfamily